MFALNVLIFITFFIISLLRYTLYPEIWFAMIRHPAQSLFLGTFPMGLATIVNTVIFVCVPAWDNWAIQLVRMSIAFCRKLGNWSWKDTDSNQAWVLWWLDVVLFLFTCFYLPFVM